MIHIECDQYSDAWWTARRGIPTASEFSRICTPAKLAYAAGAKSYICELIADRLRDDYGAPVDEYVSAAMVKGKTLEPEARKFYGLIRGVKPVQAGFCLSDCRRIGCSPDALVGEDGGLEGKSPEPRTHVAWLLAGVVPPEHVAQVHGSLIVTGRKWWDFMSYCPGFPELRITVEPDETTERLRECLALFLADYDAAWSRVVEMMGDLMPGAPEPISDEDAALACFTAGRSGRGGKPNYQSIAE